MCAGPLLVVRADEAPCGAVPTDKTAATPAVCQSVDFLQIGSWSLLAANAAQGGELKGECFPPLHIPAACRRKLIGSEDIKATELDASIDRDGFTPAMVARIETVVRCLEMCSKILQTAATDITSPRLLALLWPNQQPWTVLRAAMGERGEDVREDSK